jgi:hypothetical protein
MFFKRGLWLLLICMPIATLSKDLQQELINKSIKKGLYNSKIWKSLLHVDTDDKPMINSNTFLLSYKDFSLKNEMILNIKSLSNKHFICKYPARAFWLSKELNFDIDFNICEDFKRYINHTNPNKISLVFASENVENPSSMMGHIFFKLDGTNHKGNKVSNALSFFTTIDTINIPSLIIDSTITGMKGFFSLKPYSYQIKTYLENEDRNIWEYELKLNNFEKKLISYHFWELKSVDITYLFTSFNCATLVNNIINILSKNPKDIFWTTPKDIIKRVNSEKMVSNISLILSKYAEYKSKYENIDISKKNNPINTNKESSFSISKKIDGKGINLAILPASHTIFDDNRNYLSESELKVAHINLKLDNNIKIEQFDIFSVTSLVPFDTTTKKLSKEINISYKQSFDEYLNNISIYNINLLLGFTKKVYKDTSIYNLFGIGLGYGKDKIYPYAKNRFGVILYELQSLKTSINHITEYNNFGNNSFINSANINQSIYLTKELKIGIGFNYNYNNTMSNKELRLSLDYIF